MPSNTKKVESVLFKNKDVRNEMLSRNMGKYSQYDEPLDPPIGVPYNIRNFINTHSSTDGKGLTRFTYDGSSEYSREILHKYGLLGGYRQYSEDETFVPHNRYGTDNITYFDYVSNVYGERDKYVSFIEGILSGINPEYALRENQVGVISDVRVAQALGGIITTNPNYNTIEKIVDVGKAIYNGKFDAVKDLGDPGTDTRLGIITNTMYSNALMYGSKFNSARGRYNIEGTPYITPRLYSEYGNNSANIFRLSDIYFIDSKTGRTRDDLGADVTILEYDDATPEELGTYNFLVDQFANDGVIYTPEYGEGYLNHFPDTEAYRGFLSGFDAKFDGNLFKVNKRIGYSKWAETTQHYVYNELDNVGSSQGSSIETDENGDPILDSMEGVGVTQKVTQFDDFEAFDNVLPELGQNNLLAKTKRMFDTHKINTMVSRFHVNSGERGNDNAYNEKFGNSHGRSLLKLDARTKNYTTNTYSNPYCRTWTYHHQYERYKDAIRPFNFLDENGNATNFTIKEIQENAHEFRSHIRKSATGGESIIEGDEYLDRYTVLGNNGFVKIGPYEDEYAVADIDPFDALGKRKYMFSIENLAWKDFPFEVEDMRRGANGGRIMWFPPYDLTFQENVNVNWNESSFIGRGESVYTYTNTNRTAQLGFTLLIDHPSLFDTQAFKNHPGNGDEMDKEADILRYFAGCNNFVFRKEDDTEPDPIIEEPTIEEPEEEVEEGGKIVFAVFFPNNYSGNMREATKKEIEQQGSSDGDWWEYLLLGKNIGIDHSNPCGYEVDLTDGVSDLEPLVMSDKNKVIYACATKQNADFKPCTTENKDENRRFRYRVDFDLRQHALHVGKKDGVVDLRDDSYVDRVSEVGTTQFNADFDSVKTKTNGNFNGITCSFGEFMVALCEVLDIDDDGVITDHVGYATGERTDPESGMGAIDRIYEILSEMSVKKITVKGGATQQDGPNTKELARRRARTVGMGLKELLSRIDMEGVDNSEIEENHTDTFNFTGGEDISKKMDISIKQAKYQRCALVEIEYEKAKLDTEGNDSGEEEVLEENEEGNEDESTVIETVTVCGSNDKSRGYEYEYFSRIKEEDPVVFKLITDKFKYFDPAFHSMSPEGFNARLNFLHQCTRQGHTVSASDINGTGGVAPTAGNLSFGRMPVCILRIGDFINSRMIINSMTIQYSANGTTWDLNPEGIGVQPMFAKVDMGITLIGGSALNMPVNRLQNAMTFDYYANTGVYDPRADRVEYDGDGNVKYTHLYTPQNC